MKPTDLIFAILFGAFMCSCTEQPNDRYVNFNGKRIHILDTGQGSPTVVFITGLNCGLEYFNEVQPEISKLTRTISYDRSGLGKSDIVDSIRTIERVTDELHNILLKEKINGPFVLVGHSYGGAVMHFFTNKYPDQIAGLVFVDCSPLDHLWFDSLISKELVPKEFLYSVDTTASPGEQIEMSYLWHIDSTMRTVPFQTSVPIRLLVSTNIPGIQGEMLELRNSIFYSFINSTPQIKYTFTNKSGHVIQKDEPELVINAIKEVLDEIE